MTRQDDAAKSAPEGLPISWQNETFSFSDLRVRDILKEETEVPLLAVAFPPAEATKHVYSGVVGHIANVYISGVQPFEVRPASSYAWRAAVSLNAVWHSAPIIHDEETHLGGSAFVVRDPAAARIMTTPVPLPSIIIPKLTPLGAMFGGEPFEPSVPKSREDYLPERPGIEDILVATGNAEHSGRIFMTRDEALEDARILASIKDLEKDDPTLAILEEARPTPAFDMQKPGRVDLKSLHSETSLAEISYTGGMMSPRPLVAAAALSGLIGKDDPRLSAPRSAHLQDVAQTIRSSAHDRHAAILATAAGKVLREKNKDSTAMAGALRSLEQVAMKGSNPHLVGLVFDSAEVVARERSKVTSQTAQAVM